MSSQVNRWMGIAGAVAAVAVMMSLAPVLHAQWGGGRGRDRVTCQSQGSREQFCPARIGSDVRVARQLSDTACIQGRNWTWDRNGIRVFDGCRAEFSFRPRDGDLPPGGTAGTARVTCQSQNNREQFCPSSIGGNVRVIRNISDTRCVEGRNWRWSRDGLRVWSGCRAEFEFRRP